MAGPGYDSYYDRRGSGKAESLEVDSDGKLTYSAHNISLELSTDGSGKLRMGPPGPNYLTIEADSQGNIKYRDRLYNDVKAEFQIAGGLNNAQVMSFAPKPQFVAPLRFPPLDRLAPMQPTCVTVIRLDDSVLFDFDSAELRKSANSVLDNIATSLKASPQTLQVVGHTDSIGSEQYNLELSIRRADSVRAALTSEE